MTGEVVSVTGATGFTGGALARRLVAEGYSVRVLARDAAKLGAVAGEVDVIPGDLSNREALTKLASGADTVFHIAAMYRTEGAYADFLRTNYHGTLNILAASQSAGVRRLVYCSTVGVHGHVENPPADENTPYGPRDPYQETKMIAEKALIAEIHKSKTEIVIVRPSAIYGVGDTRMLKLFRMIAKGVFFYVGDFSPKFHPVYIDDLIEGFLLAMRLPQAAGEVFILCGPKAVALSDYVASAAEAVGAPKPWVRLPYAPLKLIAQVCETTLKPLGIQPPIYKRRLDFFKHNRAFTSAKAERMLGYRPQVDLKEGFSRTVAWYRRKGYLPPA